MFEGKQSKELQCLANPEHKSLRSDAFRELVRCAQPIAAWSPWPDVPPVTFCCVCRQNLHIADGVTSVDEALLSYFSTERLDGDNQYACSRCNTKVDAETRFFISSPPVRVVVLTSRVARGLPSSPPPSFLSTAGAEHSIAAVCVFARQAQDAARHQGAAHVGHQHWRRRLHKVCLCCASFHA